MSYYSVEYLVEGVRRSVEFYSYRYGRMPNVILVNPYTLNRLRESNLMFMDTEGEESMLGISVECVSKRFNKEEISCRVGYLE